MLKFDKKALGPDVTRMAKFADQVDRFKSTLSEEQRSKFSPDELYEKFLEYQKKNKDPIDIPPRIK